MIFNLKILYMYLLYYIYKLMFFNKKFKRKKKLEMICISDIMHVRPAVQITNGLQTNISRMDRD